MMPRDDGRGPDARLPSIRPCFLGKDGLWSGVHTTSRRGGGGGGTGPFGDTECVVLAGDGPVAVDLIIPSISTPDPFRLGVLLYVNRRLFFLTSKFELRVRTSNPFSVPPFFCSWHMRQRAGCKASSSLTEARHHHQVKVHRPRHHRRWGSGAWMNWRVGVTMVFETCPIFTAFLLLGLRRGW